MATTARHLWAAQRTQSLRVLGRTRLERVFANASPCHDTCTGSSCSSASVPAHWDAQRGFKRELKPVGLRLHHDGALAGPRRGVRCYASAEDSSSASSRGTVFTIPTVLTIARVAAIPFLIAAWYHPAPWSTSAVTAVFLAASITDWLDGYLARKLNASSPFGAFLDPVADKLMVAAVLILLCTRPLAAGPLAGDTILVPVCTLAIIGREITMSALREWAAALGPEARGAVAVSSLGKWKTAAQMTSLTLLLMVRDGAPPGALDTVAGVGGPALLVVATALTLISLADYLRALWKYMV